MQFFDPDGARTARRPDQPLENLQALKLQPGLRAFRAF
eukprot:SAG31_NODE_30115_length_385_cov_0.748252_2_plen_37_part_01